MWPHYTLCNAADLFLSVLGDLTFVECFVCQSFAARALLYDESCFSLPACALFFVSCLCRFLVHMSLGIVWV